MSSEDVPRTEIYALPVMAALCGVLGGLVYGNALLGDFVWDDRYLILDSVYTKNFDYIVDIFTKSFWDLGEAHDPFRSFYRPVVITTYILDSLAWGTNPAGFHATNLILHSAISVLVFELIRAVCRRTDLAAVASLVFLVHPIHTESVTWISGRTDLLCALFYLASLLAYLRVRPGRAGRGALVVSLACFLLALFSKEMAVTLPGALVLVELAAEPGRLDRDGLRAVAVRACRRVWPYLVLLVAAFAWRGHVLGAVNVTGFDSGPLALVLTIVHVTARYIGLLVWPLRQDVHWSDEPVLGFGDPRFPVDAAIVAATVAVLGLAAWRDRRALFGAAWLLGTLTPAFNIGSFGDVILAERFLYIPSVGFCLLVALAVLRLARGRSRPRVTAAVLVALVCLPLAVLTVRRNTVWRTEVRLFEVAAETSPRSGYVFANLGYALSEEGRYEEAARAIARAVELSPGFAFAWSIRGVVHERLGDPRAALEAHARAIELDPSEPRAYFNLANTLKALRRYGEAERAYLEAIERKPKYGEAHTNLGLLYFERGRLERAERHYLEALSLDATLAKAHNNLGGVRMAEGRWAEAARSFRTALEHDPSNAKAARNLGEALQSMGRLEDAARAFQLARALDPGLVPASLGLARVYARLGRAEDAEAVLVEALARMPDSEEMQRALERLAAGRSGP